MIVLQDGFEDQTSRSISAPWQSEGTGPKGIDLGLGFAFSGSNNAWIRTADPGWNAITQRISVGPLTTYAVTAVVRTSENVRDGYIGLRDSGGHVVGEIKFGPLPQYQPLRVDVHSGQQTDMTFYIGYWSPGEDSWIQIDDVVVSVPVSFD